MILYTLDENKKSLIKMIFVYSCITCFTAFFGAIYELFSHDVYSFYMIYAFAIPLVLGVMPCIILLISSAHMPCKIAYKAWNSGVAALTVGSVYKGVLDIYGTTNVLIFVYLVAGSVFILTGLMFYVFGCKKNAIHETANEGSDA